MAPGSIVNAWTEWGLLQEVVVGNADNGQFPPCQPGIQFDFNPEGGACSVDAEGRVVETVGEGSMLKRKLGSWPTGAKNPSAIAAANAQLDNLAKVLTEHGVKVHRPGSPSVDWSMPIATPFYNVGNQYCATCPRDVVTTIGNVVVEAAMSRRERHFEVFAYRQLIRDLWQADKGMLWKAAPRPSCADSMYEQRWYTMSDKERRRGADSPQRFVINESEVIFDAADMMRMGKDVFVHLSNTCNAAGIEWLQRELAPHGVRVHTLRFPTDANPSHMDCTFVPLRPGLVLTNPERPLDEDDARIFRENGWRFIESPQPNNPIRPWASHASKWLSMNVLSISDTLVVAEEQEVELHALLESEGFTVIKIPFRAVYEFGGGLHCSTWDIRRDDSAKDLFPQQCF